MGLDSTAALAEGLEATLRWLHRQKYTGKVVVEVCMNQGGITVAHTYRKEKLAVPEKEVREGFNERVVA